MAGLVKVPGCIPVGRLIAATDVTADTAKAQMHPARAGFQAFLAAAGARRDFPDRAGVTTAVGHSVTATRIGTTGIAAR